MIDFPIANGSNGDRDERGRFVPGWRGGPGAAAHKRNKRHAAMRRALNKAIGPEAVGRVAAKLLELAEEGDMRAIDSVLDRQLGKAVASDILRRLEDIEAALAERSEL